MRLHLPHIRTTRNVALTALVAAAALISALTATVAAGASPASELPAMAPKATSIPAEADATIRQDQATANYGWTSTLDAMVGPDRRGYLRFNVEGLAGTVAKATLSFTIAKGEGGPAEIRSVGSTSWGESAITWANAPATGAVIAAPSIPPSGRVSVDVTSAVSGNGRVAFAIVSLGRRATAYSRETGSNGPQLSITVSETPKPPSNTSPPALSGAAEASQTLSTTDGAWSGTTPMSFAYEWQRCDKAGAKCSAVPGAISAAYLLGSADVGSTLRSRVTATNGVGSASATSAASAVVKAATPPANTGLPTLSGTPAAGQTLSTTDGAWSGTTPMTFAYAWQRCDKAGAKCSAVPGAISAAYPLGSADVGSTLRSRVTATNGVGSASATSAASAVVLSAPPPAPPPPPTGDSQQAGISGMTWTLAAESESEFKKDMDVIDQSGAGWLRIDINWAMVQRDGPTSYDWAPFDRIIKDARSRGLNVLGIIDYTPAWARPSPTADAWTPPKNPADYGKFAADVAKRYGPMGVTAFEIWNEPNLGGNWKPAADPAGYTQLLKAAYTAIKSVDPSITVVSGGLSPATDTSKDRDPRTFVQGMYSNGAKGYFDALGHHPYCFPAAPGDPQNWSAWYQMYGTPNSLRSLMIANGDGDKKIWATEFGAPTNGPSGSYVSEATQAQYITKAFNLFKSYSWAGPLFVWSSRDNSTDLGSNYNFFGLIRYNYSAKPSLAAFQAAAAAG